MSNYLPNSSGTAWITILHPKKLQPIKNSYVMSSSLDSLLFLYFKLNIPLRGILCRWNFVVIIECSFYINVEGSNSVLCSDDKLFLMGSGRYDWAVLQFLCFPITRSLKILLIGLHAPTHYSPIMVQGANQWLPIMPWGCEKMIFYGKSKDRNQWGNRFRLCTFLGWQLSLKLQAPCVLGRPHVCKDNLILTCTSQ